AVADQPTTALMARFYRALLAEGLAPPAALREAQNEIRRDPRWRDPLNWAGFVFQGEWNDLPRTSFDLQ
ncbi:MAG: CHAT domain-containing protein, partial [Thermoanaerobaculia bacterium]|nr:CHAT domain-containing protein [Thermoanaerobaculia bacterium]